MPSEDGPPEEREVKTEVSAGIARWLPIELSIRRTVTNRWSRRGEEFARKVVEYAASSPEQLRKCFEENEELADSYVTAGEKAVRTSNAQLRDGLARVVAAGLRDDAKVDVIAYYVSVLAQLEPVHLRFLAANLRAGHAFAKQPGHRGNPTVKYVAAVADMPAEVASSAAERLHSMGLLTDRLGGDMVNWTAEPLGAFAVTDLGTALLAYCEEITSETPPESG